MLSLLLTMQTEAFAKPIKRAGRPATKVVVQTVAKECPVAPSPVGSADLQAARASEFVSIADAAYGRSFFTCSNLGATNATIRVTKRDINGLPMETYETIIAAHNSLDGMFGFRGDGSPVREVQILGETESLVSCSEINTNLQNKASRRNMLVAKTGAISGRAEALSGLRTVLEVYTSAPFFAEFTLRDIAGNIVLQASWAADPGKINKIDLTEILRANNLNLVQFSLSPTDYSVNQRYAAQIRYVN